MVVTQFKSMPSTSIRVPRDLLILLFRLQMVISLINVNISRGRVTLTRFAECVLCLQFLTLRSSNSQCDKEVYFGVACSVPFTSQQVL